MAKRHNVPEYTKNLARSAKQIAGSLLKTTMPTISETIVSSQEVVKEMRRTLNENRSKIVQQKRLQDNIVLKNAKVLMKNIKDDLKSGNLYNTDRMFSSSQDSMTEMLTNNVEDDDENKQSSSIDSKAFEKIISSATTASIFNTESTNSSYIAATEYMAEIEKTHHTQNLLINTKNHKEQMKVLTNLQSIGLSIVEFNTTLMADHIAKTQAYHAESLKKMDEIKDLLESSNKRYKGTTSSGISSMEKILTSRGGVNINEYIKQIKMNMRNNNPLGMLSSGMFSMLAASPISSILEIGLPYILPKDVIKKMGDIDTKFSGMIAKYFSKMDKWKHGDNSFLKFIGNTLGIDFERGSKPNLAKYQTQDITLKIEQKKAKAITEVIPNYLSEIVNAMTGKNMVYNYNTGRFVDRTSAKKDSDQIQRNGAVQSMRKSSDILNQNISNRRSRGMSNVRITDEDKDNFLYFMAVNPDADISTITYAQAKRSGLQALRGGDRAFNELKAAYTSSSSLNKDVMNSERLRANRNQFDVNRRFSDYLIDSGLSSLYNGMDDIKSKGKRKNNVNIPRINSNVSDIAENIVSSVIDYRPHLEDISYKLTTINNSINASNPFTDGGDDNTIEETVLANSKFKGISQKAKNISAKAKNKVKSIDFDSIGKNLKNGLGFIGDKAKGGLDVVKSAAVSSAMGLGALPGALLGMLSSGAEKTKNLGKGLKNKFSTGDSITDSAIENLEEAKSMLGETGGKFKRFLGNRGRNAIGAIASSMLGLGPIPGLIVSSMINRTKKKKSANKEDDYEDVSKEVSDTQEQVSGGGKFKRFLGNRGRNVKYSIISSMLGMGPIPGLILSSIVNRTKKKSDNKKSEKDADENAKALEETQNKLGFGGKIKRFFGNRGRNAIGAIASSLLGLGPIPGLIISQIYNHGKAKKQDKKLASNIESNNNTQSAETNATNEGKKLNRFKRFKNYFKSIFNSDKKGRQDQTDRKEEEMINSIKTEEDFAMAESMTSTLANIRNQKSSTSIINGDGDEPGIFDNLLNMFSNGGFLSGLFGAFTGGAGLALLVKTVSGVLGALGLKWLIKTDNNFTDAAGNVNSANVAGAIGKTGIGITKSGLSFLGKTKLATKASAGVAKLASKSPVLAKLGAGTSATLGFLGSNMGSSGLGYSAEGIGDMVHGDVSSGLANIGKSSLYITRGLNSSGMLVKIIKKIATSNIVKKLLGEKLAIKLISYGQTIATKMVEVVAKKGAKKAGMAAASNALKAIPYLNIAIIAVQAIWGFVSGYRNTNSILGLDPTYDAPVGLKIACAIVKALDDCIGGILDLLGLRDEVIVFVYKLFGGDTESIKESQSIQSSAYQDFVAKNQGTKLTQEKFNKLTNKGKDLSKYETGIAAPTSNSMTMIDNSVVNNVYTTGVGSGGRGILGTGQSAQVLRSVSKNLQLKSYGGSFTGHSVENQRQAEVKDNKGGFWSKVKGTASNIKDKIVSGAKSIWGWVKGLFGGSGGRGYDPDYYSQYDPRWANKSFGMYGGKRDTVADGGCGPTVAAMALQKLTGHNVSPSTMADIALYGGYKVDNGGTMPEFFNAAGSKYGIHFNRESGVSPSTIRSLANGKPVAFMGRDTTGTSPFGNGTHYVLGTGIDSNGNVNILDPQNIMHNRKYNIADIAMNSYESIVPSARRALSGSGRGYLINIKNKYGRGAAKQYSLAKDGDKTLGKGYFKVREFACKDGSDKILIHDGLIELLDAIKEETNGATITITSGYRTQNHNSSVGGASQSLHMDGMAADIVVSNYTPTQVAQCAEYILGSSTKGGIGVYSGWTHVDVRGSGYWRSNGSGFPGWKSSASYNIELGNRSNSGEGNDADIVASASSSSGGNKLSQLISNILNSTTDKASWLSNAFSVALGDSSSNSGSVGSIGASIGSAKITDKARTKEIYDKLRAKGISHNGALALLASAFAESSYNPESSGDNGTSYGLWQWHNNRKTKMLNHNSGYPTNTIDHQISYLIEDLKAYGLYDKFTSGNSDAKTLSDIFVKDFEKPGDIPGEQTKRKGYVDQISGILSGAGGRGSSGIGLRVPVSKVQTAAVSAKLARGMSSTTQQSNMDGTVIAVLRDIASILSRIEKSNSDIANKDFSVNMSQPYGRGQESNTYRNSDTKNISMPSISMPASNKQALIDSIISGI